MLVTGIEDLVLGCTVTDPEQPEALPMLKIDEPTLNMTFMVNTSPLAGTEGKFVTSRQIRDRLHKELLTNMALRVDDTTKRRRLRRFRSWRTAPRHPARNHAP